MAVSYLIIGGTDAPGIMIVPDGHGGYKIVRVPGWNPEQMVELGAALEVVSGAGRLKHPEVSQALLKNVSKLVESELAPAMKEAGGHTVVVVAR